MSTAIELEVQRQITALVYRNALAANIVTVISSTALAAIVAFQGHRSWQVVLAWLVGVVAVSILSGANVRTYWHKSAGDENNPRWWRNLVAGTAAMAAGWAVAVVLFLPGADAWFRLFMLMVLAGTIASGVPVLAGSPLLIRTFVGVLGAALLPALLMEHDAGDHVLVIAILLFSVAIELGAHHFGEALRTSMRLGIERKELLARAEEASRAKSEFLANISHEIRTPVGAILGFAELARTSGDPGIVLSHLAVIQRSAQSLLQVLNSVLDLSKIEAGRLTAECIPFRLDEAIDTIEAIYDEAAAQKQLDFVVRRAPNLPVCIEGDPLRLNQVLTNLLANAVKFTERGSVTLAVSRGYDANARPTLEFSVQDTGIGVDDTQRDRIFQAFTQADNSATRRFGGTGLGLTISRGLVALMGGTGPELAPDARQGCRFSFTLPCRALPNDAVRTAAQHECIAAATEPNGRHLLIVEDVDDNQVMLSAFLAQAGYRISTCRNGAEALQRQATGNFHALVMDVHMPVMDGLEATRRIREREGTFNLSRTPIVMLTADIRDESHSESMAAGADGHLVKPVRIASLTALLDRLLSEKDKTAAPGKA